MTAGVKTQVVLSAGNGRRWRCRFSLSDHICNDCPNRNEEIRKWIVVHKLAEVLLKTDYQQDGNDRESLECGSQSTGTP
jgi:hypothetical protein